MIDSLQFRSISKKNGLDLTDDQMGKMAEYVRLLLVWNQSINLVSRKDEENIWKHVIGSLSMLFKRSLPDGKVLDLGTGGGLPGIPLAILHPNSAFVLVDSIQKKIKAVSGMIADLGLPNAQAVCGRGEELSRLPEYRGRFDFVVARGVSEVRNVIAWSRPFLATGNSRQKLPTNPSRPPLPYGTLLMLKGGDLLAEIESARMKFNPKDIDIVPLTVDGGDPADFHDKKLIIITP